MAVVEVSVLIDDQHLDRFSQIMKDIKRAGMKVKQQLKDVGVITGSIDSAKIKSLQNVKGVANVEESRRFQIAPPESDVQ